MAEEKKIEGEILQDVSEYKSKTAPDSSIVFEQQPSKENVSEQSERKFQAILSQSSVPLSQELSKSTESHIQDTKDILESTDEESKIQKLVDLASTKGLVHAVNVARSLGDYYALDRMHDELVDKFYESLLSKGLIKKD